MRIAANIACLLSPNRSSSPENKRVWEKSEKQEEWEEVRGGNEKVGEYERRDIYRWSIGEEVSEMRKSGAGDRCSVEFFKLSLPLVRVSL